MKLQSNRTLYFDYHSCYVEEESPKQKYGDDLKAGVDYEFARTGTIFTVDEDYDGVGELRVGCSKFHIDFANYDDMVESGWFDIVKGGAE